MINSLVDVMNTVYVITVCRNAEAVIEETIKSVLSQTYTNVKYLIIDGASTDGTVNIIKKYEDCLAYFSSEPDNGIYDAMNKGLAVVRNLSQNDECCWVNFMNAGDSFTDNEVLEKVFCKKNVAYSDLQMIGGGTVNVFSDHSFIDPAKSPDVIPYEIPFSHQACFVRLKECSFDLRYKIAADYKIMYDIYYKYGSNAIMIVDLPIANYSKDDSFSSLNPRKAKKDYLVIQSAHPNLRWLKEVVRYMFCRY